MIWGRKPSVVVHKNRPLFRFFLGGMLSALLLLSSGLALSQELGLPSYTQYSSHKNAQDFSSLEETLKSVGPVEAQEQAHQMQLEIEENFLQARDLGYDLQLELGDEQLKEMLDNKEVDAGSTATGISELSTIDGQRFVRVLHKSSDTAYVYLNINRVDPRSKHLKKYIARQHIATNKDENGNPQGRDLVLIWYHRDSINTMSVVKAVQYLPRYKKFSPRWWVEYGRAIYKTPTMGNISFGVAIGLLQGAVTYGFELSKVLTGMATEINPYPIELSFGFGFFIASFISTYLNWKHNSSIRRNAVKSASVSILFNMLLIMCMEKSLTSLSPILINDSQIMMHWHGFINLMLALAAAYLHNLGKVEVERIPQIRREQRDSSDHIRVGLPVGLIKKADEKLEALQNALESRLEEYSEMENPPLQVKIIKSLRAKLNHENYVERSAAENQGAYMLAFTVRNAFFYFSWIGKLIPLIMIPSAKSVNLGYSEAVNYERHNEIQNEWERMFRWVPKPVRKIFSPCANGLKNIGRGIAKSLAKNKQTPE